LGIGRWIVKNQTLGLWKDGFRGICELNLKFGIKKAHPAGFLGTVKITP